MDEERRRGRGAEKCWRVPSDPEGYLGQQVQRQPRVDGRVVLFFIGVRFCFANENSFFLRAAYF